MNLKIEQMNNPKCINCSQCCDLTTIITLKEIEIIKKHVLNSKKLMIHIKKRIFKYIKHMNNDECYLKCVFSHQERYIIYKIRPSVCKMFHCDTSPYPNTPTKKYKYTVFNALEKIIKYIDFEEKDLKNVEKAMLFLEEGTIKLKQHYQQIILDAIIKDSIKMKI